MNHVSIFEYDEERVMEIIKRDQKVLGREEGLEEGVAKGRAEGIAKDRAEAVIMLLERQGMIPEDLKNKIIQGGEYRYFKSMVYEGNGKYFYKRFFRCNVNGIEFVQVLWVYNFF